MAQEEKVWASWSLDATIPFVNNVGRQPKGAFDIWTDSWMAFQAESKKVNDESFDLVSLKWIDNLKENTKKQEDQTTHVGNSFTQEIA